MKKIIKKWYKNFSMTPTEKYLSQATDCSDLERRMKNLEYGVAPNCAGTIWR